MKIKCYTSIRDLTGYGEEWLLDPVTEQVVAVFLDGCLRTEVAFAYSNEDTKICS